LTLIESKHDFRSLDQDRTPDQIRILHHQVDRFLLRLRQRPLLPDRAARADEIEEPVRVDVPFEELARRRLLVDVDFVDVDARLCQSTSGVLARGSRRFPVELRFRHGSRIIEIADCQLQIAD
jgi:hypothetical protein